MNPLSKILFERNLKRAKKFSDFCRGCFKEGWKVLDIGLGNGHIANAIKKEYKVGIQGIDVIDYNRTGVEFRLFDGKHIPFKDNEFDVAIIIVSLHHCDNPYEVIQEAARVAKRVIVFEDIYTSPLHLKVISTYDWLMNVRKGVNTPFNFKRRREWIKLFEKVGMKPRTIKRFRETPWYSPMKTTFFFFEKNSL